MLTLGRLNSINQKVHTIVLFIIALFLCLPGTSQETITITYIGNMGVHIAGDKSSVLIDGLHTKYGEDYLFPSKELVKSIRTNFRPDAILFTHRHGDHFNAELSTTYLQSNEKALLFGPQQVTSKIQSFEDRIFTITTKDYSKQTINAGNIKVTGFKINHAGKRHITIENVGYIIHIKDKNILHVGDTDWMSEIKLFDHLHLVKENIDIAIIPYWMLLHENALSLVKKHIKPQNIIATHISPKIKEQELQKLKDQYPNIHFLTKSEEQIQL